MSSQAHIPIAPRLLAAAAMVVVLAAGTLAFGRVSDDASMAMGLTAIWWGLVFAGGVLIALRRPAFRWWLAAGYVLVALVAGVVLVLPTLRDKEVNEKVVTGAPLHEPRARPTENVQVASGSFRSVAHDGRGDAAVVRLAGGKRVVTLTDFETSSGPDLRLYVSTGDPADGGLGAFKDLGALKGNKGNQQYELPRGLDLGRYSTVVVWCRAFSVPFTSARLRA